MDENNNGATGANENEVVDQQGTADTSADTSTDDTVSQEGTNDPVTRDEATPAVETAMYRITGLVDVFDEQGNITGQLPIGSEAELPVEVGDVCVADGRAERIEAVE